MFSATANVYADQADQARYYDAAAREHFQQRRWLEALEDFFAAQALAPSPNLAFNIAVCFEQLGDYRDAYTYYSESLEGPGLDAAFQENAKQALNRLEGKVARLMIHSEPPGAHIYIDDAKHGDYGKTPRSIAVDPGEHEIWVVLDGHEEARSKVSAKLGQEAQVELSPKAIVGTLSVAAVPPPGFQGVIAVRVLAQDGRLITKGKLPFEQALPQANYRVYLEAETLQPWSQSAYVKARSTTEVEAELAFAPRATGDISAVSTLPGSVVELDGVQLGTAPLVIPNVLTGNHQLKFTSPGAPPVSADVSVAEQQRTWATASYDLEERTSPTTWWVGGAGALALATGAGLMVESDRRFSAGDLSGESLQTAGVASLAVGSAALAAAIILYFVTGEEVPRGGELTFTVGEQ